MLESKARALSALGDHTGAIELADNILNATPDHDDFRVVALSLKIHVLQAAAQAGSDTCADDLNRYCMYTILLKELCFFFICDHK